MTAVFNWNASFLVGIDQVDTQHQQLVELINDVGELALGKHDVDLQQLRAAYEAMCAYALTHFRAEEALMDAAGVAAAHAAQHRAQHQSFAAEASSLLEQSGSLSLDQARKMLHYLVDWLAYHILGTDQSMARQMQAIEAGASPAEALATDRDRLGSGAEPLVAALKALFEQVSRRNQELRKLNATLEQQVLERTHALHEANRKLQALAVHDELTGLPNRRFAMTLLNDLWAHAREHGSTFSVLLLDADKFKQVNDTYGHATGDTLLRSLAGALRESVRTDDAVCRLGGDEFLVICPGCAPADAAGIADKILAADKSLRDDQGTECWNGAVSIGVAGHTPRMRRTEDILEAADGALYSAKRAGGGCARLAPEAPHDGATQPARQ